MPSLQEAVTPIDYQNWIQLQTPPLHCLFNFSYAFALWLVFVYIWLDSWRQMSANTIFGREQGNTLIFIVTEIAVQFRGLQFTVTIHHILWSVFSRRNVDPTERIALADGFLVSAVSITSQNISQQQFSPWSILHLIVFGCLQGQRNYIQILCVATPSGTWSIAGILVFIGRNNRQRCE